MSVSASKIALLVDALPEACPQCGSGALVAQAVDWVTTVVREDGEWVVASVMQCKSGALMSCTSCGAQWSFEPGAELMEGA